MHEHAIQPTIVNGSSRGPLWSQRTAKARENRALSRLSQVRLHGLVEVPWRLRRSGRSGAPPLLPNVLEPTGSAALRRLPCSHGHVTRLGPRFKLGDLRETLT